MTKKMLKITLVRSSIGFDQTQKDTVRSLGLRKLHKTVTVADTPQVRGMVYKVRHLVQVEELEQ
ncbi:MAG: 50S ribosomal protein L30 [Anaerolineae bacterium]|nr:50S ribosomal protein L30 [Anaerolineae bacterium]